MMILLKLLFWTKKAVIWQLFNNDLSAREQEGEEKRTRNSVPRSKLKKHSVSKTVRIKSSSSDPNILQILRPSASNFKIFSLSLEIFFS